MSNWKFAYGWSGHILTSLEKMDSDPRDNVVAIPDGVFKAILEAHENCGLDERIQSAELGITCTGETCFLATGSCFSTGFTHYGTVFEEAEARSEPGPPAIDRDAIYLEAMKEIYGLDLPPCRLMVGCSSEE